MYYDEDGNAHFDDGAVVRVVKHDTAFEYTTEARREQCVKYNRFSRLTEARNSALALAKSGWDVSIYVTYHLDEYLMED